MPLAEAVTKLAGFSISDSKQKYTSRTATSLDVTKTYHSKHMVLKNCKSWDKKNSLLKFCIKRYLDCVWDAIDEDACI